MPPSQSLRRPGESRLGLAANMGLAVGLAGLGNGIIALFGLHAPSSGQVAPSFAPPGLIIGVIWTVLFAAMGAARWLTLHDGSALGRANSRLVTGLILICFAYPYYTLGFNNTTIGMIGSLVTMALAALLAWRLDRQSRLAALLVSGTALWCAYACLIFYCTM